jgi:hypothetical protein
MLLPQGDYPTPPLLLAAVTQRTNLPLASTLR